MQCVTLSEAKNPTTRGSTIPVAAGDSEVSLLETSE